MNINEMLKATGRLTIERTDSSGQLVERVEIPNLVVAVGKTFIASRMVGTSAAVMSHMSIGSNNPELALATGNTQLGNELGKVALTSSTASSNSVTYVATFPAGTGSGDIKEAGIFNASGTNTGTMLCRTTFPIVTKQSGDSITVTWVVTVN